MRKIIGWTVAAILAVGLGGFAYVWFSGGSGEPSTEITTPTIPPTTEGGSGTGSTTEPTTGSTISTGSEPTAFVIDPEQSSAVFVIDEVLRGSPNTVEGTTSELGGQVVVDPADLSKAQLSEIVVNGRTFTTDSGFRDRAIRGPVILNSADDAFEFITFAPTGISGLSGSAAAGDSFSFQVSGDLTVKGTTNSEVFEVTALLVDDTRIEGVATAVITRDDYGIGIPNAPGVADVAPDVEIRLEFVAVAN